MLRMRRWPRYEVHGRGSRMGLCPTSPRRCSPIAHAARQAPRMRASWNAHMSPLPRKATSRISSASSSRRNQSIRFGPAPSLCLDLRPFSVCCVCALPQMLRSRIAPLLWHSSVGVHSRRPACTPYGSEAAPTPTSSRRSLHSAPRRLLRRPEPPASAYRFYHLSSVTSTSARSTKPVNEPVRKQPQCHCASTAVLTP
jgi:hypothetical protein